MNNWQQAIVILATIGLFTVIYFAWFFLTVLIDCVKSAKRVRK